MKVFYLAFQLFIGLTFSQTTSSLNQALVMSLTDRILINGAQSNDNFGVSVSLAGDFNKDGLSDFIVGAPKASLFGRNNVGAAYVIYGKGQNTQSEFNLNPPTSIQLEDGFQINGASTIDILGFALSYAGDINNDGIDDIIIGALKYFMQELLMLELFISSMGKYQEHLILILGMEFH